MAFFTDSQAYTHIGSFYRIPVYLNLEQEIPVIEGTNKFFDWCFSHVARFHNNFIETPSVFLAFSWKLGYKSGFHFKVTGELIKSEQ